LDINSKVSNDIDKTIDSKYTAYSYRWVVLLLFMFIGAMTQVIWITFGGIIDESASFYGVSDNLILLTSVVFMIAYIPVNFLASWLLDKFGLKWGAGIGVILTGVFGMLRPVISGNYGWLMFCTVMCAIGQPFVLNSFTKLAATWFPEKEKTLAAGLGTISLLIGVIIAFLTIPFLLGPGPIFKMDLVLYLFGGITLLSAILYLIFVKDKPPTPPNAYADKTKVLSTEGTRSLFKKRDFVILFIVLLIGGGVFNAISSVLDIVFDYPIGAEQPGLIGGIMIIGGIIGAGVMSTLSDKFRKRKIFILIALLGGVVFMPLLIFISNDIARYIFSFFMGFLLVSALPVGLTFAAEVTHPVPEETSNGLMMWIGQIVGVILLGGIMLTEYYNPNLIYINIIIMIVMFVIGVVLVFFMNDLDAYEKT